MEGVKICTIFVVLIYGWTITEKGVNGLISNHVGSNPLRLDFPDVGAEDDLENEVKYVPTWKSLDTRPLPDWFDESKVGIFIHWGVFSVPAYEGAWFWENWINRGNVNITEFMKSNYPPRFTYMDFGPQFTAEFFNPYDWAEIFQNSGAKYVVLTSKHHEGFTLWPSKYSFGWNAVDVGPKRDLVGDLALAIRNKTNLKFGLYHSLYEWFNPHYINDKQNNFSTNLFVTSKTMPELYELVNNYEPEVIWSDGDWESSDDYWKSREFLAWLYNESPVKDTVVTNDRWGAGCMCKHGGYYTCADRYNPGHVLPHKWENCMTLDKYFWANRRNANVQDYLTPWELVKTLIETVSCGGNILINVGPTKEGMIVPIQQERLLQLGKWLKVNGDAIYGTTPWKHQNDTINPNVWYTARPAEKAVFALTLTWSPLVKLGAIEASEVKSIELLGTPGVLRWTQQANGIFVKMPNWETVVSRWAWTLRITTC